MLWWFWVALGISLLVAEFFVSGFVVAFFGVSALLSALSSWLGLTTSWASSSTFFIVTSALSFFFSKRLADRYFPKDSVQHDGSEEAAHRGQRVKVESKCTEDRAGQIRYQGTLWRAVSLHGEIKAGADAKILYFDQGSWVIEALETDLVPDTKSLNTSTSEDLAETSTST